MDLLAERMEGFKTKIISIHLIRGVIMCLPFLEEFMPCTMSPYHFTVPS